jgi:hypothetical protein
MSASFPDAEPQSRLLPPACTAPAQTVASLREHGYALLQPQSLSAVLDVDVQQLVALQPYWDELPRDEYLRDGGRYRSRRHSCFIQSVPGPPGLTRQRAHWQPTSYNALHGGMLRWYQPIAAPVLQAQVWRQLLQSLGSLFSQTRASPTWYIEAHQFRIDTAGGIGRPTPEGAHRDGVDFVALALVQRRNIRGGETRVFQADGFMGIRFLMAEPWSLLLLDDTRVIHETTPIQMEAQGGGMRDTLVLTYRAEGFQAPVG